jgi:hypothetical protein
MTQEHSTADQHSRSFASIALAIVCIGFSILVEGALLLFGRRFANLVDELELEVSAVTRLATSPVIPLFLGGIILFAIAKELVGLRCHVIDVINLFVFLFGAACSIVFVFGIVLAWLSLIEDLP